MPDNNHYFQLLHDIAEDATLVRHSRHAACVVHRDRILSIGTAKYKSHPIMQRYQTVARGRIAVVPEQIYLHAEVDAILRAANRFGTEILKDSSLHVLRLTKGGNVSLSKPCVVCERVINAFDITDVHWSE